MKIYLDQKVPERLKLLAGQYAWFNAVAGATDGFEFCIDQSRLALRDLSENSWSPFVIDFLEPQWLLRLKRAHQETQLLKRAIGFKPQDKILLWDATAGLGRDAVVIAHLGYRVIAVERSRVLYELLFDAFARARCHPDLQESFDRIELLHGDSKELLEKTTEENRPDVIYLDPMYPASKKSAQPKKEMQILRKLLGPDDNLEQLFNAAKLRARSKVILKNSPRNTIFTEPKHSLVSKSVRFDIF